MFFENDVFLQVTVFVGLFVSLDVARPFFSSCLELLAIFFCQKTNNFAMQFNQIFSNIIVLAGNSKVSTCLEQNDPGHHWKH